jgi:hypothetical protein
MKTHRNTTLQNRADQPGFIFAFSSRLDHDFRPQRPCLRPKFFSPGSNADQIDARKSGYKE